MLTIPVVYNDATKRIAVSEEWAGTVIDDRSTMFSVSGIPSEAVSAKLDVKVAIKQSNKKLIRPFLILNGIESGTGTATVPQELFYACKRDLKFIFQLEIMTEEETYASENWLTFKVSPAIVKRPSQMPLWDQDRVLVDAYEVDNEKIIFKRFNGEEFAILLSDNPVEWESIEGVPWRSEWTEGVPADNEILVESLVRSGLDAKTDIIEAVPQWNVDVIYKKYSTVLRAHKIYESLKEYNQGHEVTETDWWKELSGGSGPTPTPGEGLYKTVIGDGTSTEFTVVHDLGTKFYLYNLIDNMTGENIDASVTMVDDVTVKIKFRTAPRTDSINVIFSTGAGGGGSVTIQSITKAEIDALFP